MIGITEITNKHCSVVSCHNPVVASIGDKRYAHNLKNLFLCEEHLKSVYKELKERYFDVIEPILNERNTEDNIKGQELLKGYVKLVYEANGMLSKAKLAEFCIENGIEVEEGTMKQYMEAILPELKEN